MPAASEAIPIRAPSGTQRTPDGVTLTGVTDQNSFEDFSRLDSNCEDNMLRYAQNSSDDGSSVAPVTFQDNADISIALPVTKLLGEVLESTTDTGSGSVYITNYRIVILDRVKNAVAIVPLLCVDLVEFWSGDTNGIQITCKYGRIFRLRCASEVQVELHKRLQKATCSIRINDIFAWHFAKLAMMRAPSWLTYSRDTGDGECSAQEEFDRLGYNPDFWRITDANRDYTLCPTYPRLVIVPKKISDEDLRQVCHARNNARFPTAVWCYAKNESVLLRSSQPCCGIFNYRYPKDEELLECARCAVSDGQSSRKFLVVDCRSYTAVLANRVVKGGGAESEQYYQQTEVVFSGLVNIHEIRYSFHKLRSTLAGPQDPNTILQSIQSSAWLQHIKNLIDRAQKCVRALVDEGRSVLVHCTDGWDRTTQIVTLAKIIADPYYRTFVGFKHLIRRDWIDFGHKFADRTGINSKVTGETSPVFLQWLDCVYQLHHMFPDAFQFNINYLTKLALHSYSGLFGTFLWNSQCERRKYMRESAGDAETLSIWSYLDGIKSEFFNVIYDPVKSKGRLHVSLHIEDLHIWKQLYVGPSIERLINDQTLSSGMGMSQHSEVDRISLYRAHSAESLSNTEPGPSQAPANTAFAPNTHSQFHSSTTRTSISSETDYARPEEDSSFSEYRERDRSAIAKEIDCDGLTKVVVTREERTREKVERLQEQINSLKDRIDQLSAEGMRKTSGTYGESPRAEPQFGESSSASCSVESVLSNMSVVEKEDVADISYGSKGWLMDNASPKCMGCGIVFRLNNRRHHCRNCGNIFCATCTKCTFFRVHENKGDNVRVCNKCYLAMTPGPSRLLHPLQPNTAPPQPRAAPPGSENHDTTNKPPTTFIIGNTDGQTVCG